MNRTDRLLAIVLELQAKGWQRAEDLAKTFEISKRTIYRDMEALAESGVPIISSPGQGYSLMAGYFLPPLSFNTDEAIVLLLGADYMAQNFDAQYSRAARSTMSKIEAVLSPKLREDVSDLKKRMRFTSVLSESNQEPPELLAQLRRAIVECRTIRFEYHARFSDAPHSVREADPYALVNYEHRWYIRAYDHYRKDVRNFRLERMEQVRVLDKVFTPVPEITSSAASDGERSLTVRVLFSPEVARWVREERSFFTVSEEDCPEGLLVTLRVRLEDEIVHWLLGWGAGAHVLEPESLRQRLAEEARRMVEQYQKS